MQKEIIPGNDLLQAADRILDLCRGAAQARRHKRASASEQSVLARTALRVFIPTRTGLGRRGLSLTGL